MICGREQNRVAEGSRPPTKGGAGARAARALRARNPYKTGKSLVKVWEKYRKSRGKYRKSTPTGGCMVRQGMVKV